MLDSAVRSVLSVEGAAVFVTTGAGGAHLVATWQSYIEIVDDSTIMFPAGGYRVTEANLGLDASVQMVIGSRIEPQAIGFRLTGTARLENGTALHESLKQRFPWCRAAVVMRVTNVEQILGG